MLLSQTRLSDQTGFFLLKLFMLKIAIQTSGRLNERLSQTFKKLWCFH